MGSACEGACSCVCVRVLDCMSVSLHACAFDSSAKECITEICAQSASQR